MDIRALWTAVLAQDEEAIRPFFHPDARVVWVCTNDRFTLDEYITANCRYPGSWEGEVERVEEQGEQLITVTRVWPRDRSFSVHAVSFFRLRGDKVARLEEYWADDGPPPQWRQEMKLGQPLK